MKTLKRLGHGKLKLNEYESELAQSGTHLLVLQIFIERIASEVIRPDDIDVRLSGNFCANIPSSFFL